jgi:thioredoxin-related protein
MYHMSIGLLGKAAAVALAAGLLWPACAFASELVMFERAGCPWCQRWDREVGATYAKTSEARRLPLRRVDIHSGSTGGIVLASPVRYTPTFVVVDEGREVGRITGYINDESFWGLLSALAAKLKSARDAGQI